jgi:glutamate-1-semialdehyde 2,1-aminomutase
MDRLLTAFKERTHRSQEFNVRSKGVLPGGETRSVTHFAPYPVAIDHGAGSVVWDIDGNEYVDVLNNYTALIHGHAATPITDAAVEAVRAGSAHAAPGVYQAALAECLTQRYPALDLVRFTNSGTEAALLALRIARHATGRRRLLTFDGGYHGAAPEFVDASEANRRIPFNDLAAVESALDESVAAVFVEPFLGSGGVVPAAPDFLQATLERAHATGALFVLDECQSLRSHLAGVHGELGLDADLIMMGKIIGGGFPVGAVGGRRGILDLTAADRPGTLRHSGTFNGNAVTMAAGIAAVRLLDGAAIAKLNARASWLAEQIEGAGCDAGVPVRVSRYGSILHVHFADRLPTSAADVAAEPAMAAAALHLALLIRGVYAAPRGMLNLSTAISDAQMDQIKVAYRQALLEVARVDVDWPSTIAPRQ